MILKIKGKAWNLIEPIVGRVYKSSENTLLISDEINSSGNYAVKAILTTDSFSGNSNMPTVSNILSLNHLSENDIVVVNTDGVVNTLYRVASHHNFMLFTERCNSNCLMCSQPPKDKDDTDYLYDVFTKLIPLIPKDCVELGITGGEPTLMANRFFSLLDQIKIALPETEIHCLTNGRSFAWKNVASKLGEMNYRNLMLGIPLYSDIAYQHDYIVQAKHAFKQTIEGLYNLAVYDQRLEIRVVLHKATIPRLEKLARFIYKNLPFVEHVAFMGLEHQGYTPFNIDKLWIDPINYQNELSEAVSFLDDFGINVSIYNSQLCLLPEHLWKFTRKSISDWKNVYLDECNKCTLLEQCGGLFASAMKKHSPFIRPL